MLAVAIFIGGCGAIQTHRGEISVPDSDRSKLASFSLPIKAASDQIVLYVAHKQQDNDKPYRKSIAYEFDDGKSTILPSNEYQVHQFSYIPKQLRVTAICNDSEKFESRMPSDGIITLSHPYALKRTTEVQLLESLKPGETYIISVSPGCFRNRYDGSLSLSKGSITLLDEGSGKYLIFSSKRNSSPSTN